MFVRDLVRVVLQTSFEAFSAAQVAHGKARFIDVVGCALGGAFADGNDALLRTVRDWGGRPEATILVHGDRVPAAHAAMTNAVMARSYDYEACGPLPLGAARDRMPGHICATTETTALAAGEARHRSGREVLTAALLGGDLAVRIAVAEDFSFEEGFDSTGTVCAFGAAAVAGRLWGATEDQLSHAFGLLVNDIGGSFQTLWDGAQAFKLPQGLSARNALWALELALNGMTGIEAPLTGPRGYFAQYCKGFRSEFLTQDLGTAFATQGLHKAQPACYGSHSAIEAALQLRPQVAVDHIEQVRVAVFGPIAQGFLGQPFRADDTPVRALFSLPYTVASALVRGESRLAYFTEEGVRDPRVLDLAARVQVEAAATPTLADMGVTVTTRSGQTLHAGLRMPRGLAESPLTLEEIEQKYWTNYEHARPIPRRQAEEALDRLRHFEEVDDVATLTRLLKK